MLRDRKKRTAKKVEKKETKEESNIGKIELMGVNKQGEEIYRRWVSDNSFEIGVMVNGEFALRK